MLDSHGLVVEGRPGLDDDKMDGALPRDAVVAMGLDPDAPHDLREVVAAFRPDVLLGTTGVGGAFTEATIRAMAEGCERPIVLPLSNPTSATEARPSDILAWTEGRAVGRHGQPVPTGRDRRSCDPHPAGQQRVRLPGHRPRGHRLRGADPARLGVPGRGPPAGRHGIPGVAGRGRPVPADRGPAQRGPRGRDRRGRAPGRAGCRAAVPARRDPGRGGRRDVAAGLREVRGRLTTLRLGGGSRSGVHRRYGSLSGQEHRSVPWSVRWLPPERTEGGLDRRRSRRTEP